MKLLRMHFFLKTMEYSQVSLKMIYILLLKF